jgi:hypothetical protein
VPRATTGRNKEYKQKAKRAMPMPLQALLVLAQTKLSYTSRAWQNFQDEYLPVLSWHQQRGQLVFTTTL